MRAPRFLDTNVLLYSISHDPTEVSKRDRAIRLIEADDNALSVQVLQEFYVQATRPARPDAVPHQVRRGSFAPGCASKYRKSPCQS